MTDNDVAPFSFLALDRNGRFLSALALDHLRGRLASSVPPITDVFVFCSGGIEDPIEAKAYAARFLGALRRSLDALGDRVTPLWIALHWPSSPFSDAGARDLLAHVQDEIPLAPEEEAEFDALLETGQETTKHSLRALRAWLTKKRAGEVGERFGRERLAPLWASWLPAGRRRLHLVGHSFGARLLTSSVLGGVRPNSLTLLQAPFSAFAFAGEVPGSGQPGLYNRILAARLAGRIVVVRSARDAALATLCPPPSGVDHPGRLGRTRQVVASSLMGITGAHGAGATEVEIREAQRLGLPLRPIVNVDASALIRAHDDILHPEVATIVLMAAGLLVGGPDGPRPKPVVP
jgi:hypothetical protein